MNTSRTVRGALSAFILLCLNAAAATLTVKSGAVHEGKVHGTIVLKGDERETQSEQDPSKTVYWGTYTVFNGASLGAVDTKGVHLIGSQPVTHFELKQEDAPLDDLDVLSSGQKIQPGAFATGTTKAAGNITRTDNPPAATPSRDTVLGEYRVEGGKAELRPVIEIETAKGIVKVPVADLVQLTPQ